MGSPRMKSRDGLQQRSCCIIQFRWKGDLWERSPDGDRPSGLPQKTSGLPQKTGGRKQSLREVATAAASIATTIMVSRSIKISSSQLGGMCGRKIALLIANDRANACRPVQQAERFHDRPRLGLAPMRDRRHRTLEEPPCDM